MQANHSEETPISHLRTPEQALQNLEIPLAENREQVRAFMREHPNFVLVGETGSGKTTCLPPLLLELKQELNLKGKIAITQPRRVAASSVAKRVANMMDCEIGEQVGYQVRFEDHTSEGTDLNFMTDGILLRKMQYDPLLSEYSIVMVDEAHERSLNIDLCLGLLKDCNKRRKEAGMEEIRVVVTSATIEKEKFANFFGDGSGDNSIEIPGKMYPVEVKYIGEPVDDDYTRAAAAVVEDIVDPSYSSEWELDFIKKNLETFSDFRPIVDRIYSPDSVEPFEDPKELMTEFSRLINKNIQNKADFKNKVWEHIKIETSGDILIFMPGKQEIAQTIEKIKEKYGDNPDIEIVPLHAEVSPEEQDKAVSPSSSGKRKIVVSTNIAETSVTIPGVRTLLILDLSNKQSLMLKQASKSLP